MPADSTISFNKTGKSLFTPEEVRHLMRVEFDRAQRYQYPISCMMIQIDRLEQLHTVYGYESKETLVQACIELVKSETRASDFLGCQVGDRVLAIFPHTNVQAVTYLADRLLAGAREMNFEAAGRRVRLTLSIGLSHNQHHGALSFDTLVRVAEEGLAVADSSGGDRFIETELYQLYERQIPVADPVAPLPASREGDGVRARLLELMEENGSLEESTALLAEEIVARAMGELEEAQRAAPAPTEQAGPIADSDEEDYKRQIDILQRRVNKLTASLGLTEQELTRVRQLKQVDDGVSSIYREVQGLAQDDARHEVKRELMSRIFEANLDLRKPA